VTLGDAVGDAAWRSTTRDQARVDLDRVGLDYGLVGLDINSYRYGFNGYFGNFVISGPNVIKLFSSVIYDRPY
jgi:hypothetical protein